MSRIPIPQSKAILQLVAYAYTVCPSLSISTKITPITGIHVYVPMDRHHLVWLIKTFHNNTNKYRTVKTYRHAYLIFLRDFQHFRSDVCQCRNRLKYIVVCRIAQRRGGLAAAASICGGCCFILSPCVQPILRSRCSRQVTHV